MIALLGIIIIIVITIAVRECCLYFVFTLAACHAICLFIGNKPVSATATAMTLVNKENPVCKSYSNETADSRFPISIDYSSLGSLYNRDDIVVTLLVLS